MGFLTMLSTPLCLLLFFLCFKTAFSSSVHASSLSTTQLCSHEEAVALLQFKTSFSIKNNASYPDFCNNDFYAKPYSKTESWKEGIDCCSWDGISCDNVTGYVIALDLSCSFLYGTFPSNSTLFLLKNLQTLNLSFNDFRLSKIPPEISQLTSLRLLDLSYSHFSGQVPGEISHLSKLVSLNLSNFAFDGSQLILETTTFRNLVHNLSEVRELVLYRINVASVNPCLLANLSSSLTTLDLLFYEFRGNFPSSIFLFPNLKVLRLGEGSPELSVDFPRSNWSSPLQELKLYHKDCGGKEFPESIGDLKSLHSLVLFSCNLKGSIPASIGNLSKLTDVNFRHNNFRSQIPSSLTNLTQLSFLDLSNNQLSGPIPLHGRRFSKLSHLDLSHNLLNGTMPPWVFNLPSLQALVLDHNLLQGQINQFHQKSLITIDLAHNNLRGLVEFDVFSKLQSLESIILTNNNLSLRINVDANFTFPKLKNLVLSSCNLSEFPSFLRHSNVLQVLDLSFNNLSGKIPNYLPKLMSKSLSVLNLHTNNFDGDIPFSFPVGCGLQSLDLHENKMEGLLPRSLVNCRLLEVLNVANNKMEDTFPHWLESLPNLKVLVLRSNKFHGSVIGGKESQSFPQLRILDLSNNDFLGPLPVRYIENFKAMVDPHKDGNFSQYMMTHGTLLSYLYRLVVTMKGVNIEMERILSIFTSIDLSNNKFRGEIPYVIGKLSSLKGLNLSNNNLDSCISPSLGNLTNLEWLDLSSNKLVGKIPKELLSLTQLSVLNLSNNQLVGLIPEGKQFNTFTNDSYKGNLGLCGFPLSKSCDGNGTKKQPLSSFHEKDESWGFGWRVVLLGYGCGLVFGLLMGYLIFWIGKPKWFVTLFDAQTNQSGRKMKKAQRNVQRRNHLQS